MTLTQAQALAWVRERWPDRTDPTYRALKLGEEAGEVQGAVIKMGEGRKTLADLATETAQLVICAMALAESAGFDLQAEIEAEWERCQSRVWTVTDTPPRRQRSLSFDYVAHVYGVTPRIGQRVRVDGRAGMIVPRPDHIGEHYIAVQFDATGVTNPCHPTWEVEYL